MAQLCQIHPLLRLQPLLALVVARVRMLQKCAPRQKIEPILRLLSAQQVNVLPLESALEPSSEGGSVTSGLKRDACAFRNSLQASPQCMPDEFAKEL